MRGIRSDGRLHSFRKLSLFRAHCWRITTRTCLIWVT
nr:MAG TPA: hypothetical protein [Caudoviricetes sp.]